MKLSKLLSISVLSISTLLTGCKPNTPEVEVTPTVGSPNNAGFDVLDKSNTFSFALYPKGRNAKDDFGDEEALSITPMTLIEEDDCLEAAPVSINNINLDAAVIARAKDYTFPDYHTYRFKFVIHISNGTYRVRFSLKDYTLTFDGI